jgi:CO/xanthine dehydrogenase Mo-binding subunit
MGDTSVVPFDSSTSASRSTVFMGNAVTKACRDVKEKLKHMAARTFGVDESKVRVGDGLVRMTGREIDYEQLLHACFGPPRGEVIGVGHEANAYDAAHPLGGRPAFWEMMCAAAEVEVDPEVGMVQIVKLVLVSDIGKALNPQQVEAQDEGAAVMGLGHTFMEQLLLDDRGRIRNLGALDYRIPTIEDGPGTLHSILIENEDGPGPHGAKGAGEGGILAIAAAVGAAVNEAAGIQLRDLPLTPERVWRAVRDRSSAGDQ